MDDPRPVLGKILEEEHGVRLFPVHRLDEVVSGVVIFAKSSMAHQKACLWFEKKLVSKEYEALSSFKEGVSSKKPYRWESKILRGKKRAYEKSFGKLAITTASFVRTEEREGVLLMCWRLRPVTGKPHQLRFEMFKQGMPLVGDELYCGELKLSTFKPDRIALRAVRLDFSKIKEEDRLGLPLQLKVEGLF